MSGHSHWAGIKHKKGIEDAKRAKVFAKLARVITIATREKGGNPDMNPSLRLAVEKARAANMPSDNIERAIKRGTGGEEGSALEGFCYEAFAPGGVAILIEGITDNKNRTLSEIRKILSTHGGRMAEQGSVQWMFDRRGCLAITTPDSELELKIIDAGAEDIKQTEQETLVYTAPDKVMEVKKNLEGSGIAVSSMSFAYIPKNPMPAEDDATQKNLERLFDALDEHDDVQEIYANIL